MCVCEGERKREPGCLRQTVICPVGFAQQHAIGRSTSRKARGEVGHLFIWGGKGHVVLGALSNIWVGGGWGQLNKPTPLSYKGHSWADAAQNKPPIPPFHLTMKAFQAVLSSFYPTLHCQTFACDFQAIHRQSVTKSL